MKKFDATFQSATENSYPYLRFVRAEYSRSGNTLIVFFIASSDAIDNGTLNDNVKKEVEKVICANIPPSTAFSVKYIKAYADEETVRIKLMQALSNHLSVAAGSITPQDVNISVNEYVINIKIKASKTYYSLLEPQKVIDKLIENLNENFVENINIEIMEKYISIEDNAKIIEKSKQTLEKSGLNCTIEIDKQGNVTNDNSDAFAGLLEPESIVLYEQTRQIKATPVSNLVGKTNMNVLPMYICDIKDTLEVATIGGTVCGCQRREYRNKNYIGEDYRGEMVNSGADKQVKPKRNINTTDKTFPMYSFSLDDTTGKFPVVMFMRTNDDTKINQYLTEGAQVVVNGKLSTRNGALQMIVDRMWLAELDFATIKLDKPLRKENKNYLNVVPEKYFEESQADFSELLEGKKEVAPFLKGKTFVAFDFETTGLDTSKCQVVQIGSYKIVDGKIVESFNTLVNPCCHIPEETSSIHGIYDDDVKNELEIHEVIADFYKFTRDAILIGHNAFGYDLPILTRLGKAYNFNFDNQVLDTMIIAKNQVKVSGYSLTNLCKHFDIDLSCAHNASFDALATAKLFIRLANNM